VELKKRYRLVGRPDVPSSRSFIVTSVPAGTGA
jgi:hypothetical protein